MARSQMGHLHDPNRRIASPLSRALARREGLELASLSGSGPRGRIIKADVLAALSGVALTPARSGIQSDLAFDEIPNTIGRKLIARRLTESKQLAPHFYMRADCNVDAVLRIQSECGTKDGVKLSVNDFVIKAAALALRAVPTVNASYTESAIRRYRPINIAVAVALGEGLVTPVIEDADLKSMAKISSSVKDFAAQARAGKLAPGSTRGGTFSVSNLGGYGVREFTAVINPPQAAILAVGVAEPRAVVQNGKLSIATMMTVTLSADHRVIDGAVAAEWLSAFRKFMENP